MNLNTAMGMVMAAFPNATVGEDNDGQIIIYTDMTVDNEENLVPFEA